MEALRERFGKYHVLEKIAQGGMAEVYKVKTVGIAGFEKIQALKRILPHQGREPRFIRSFIDEEYELLAMYSFDQVSESCQDIIEVLAVLQLTR